MPFDLLHGCGLRVVFGSDNIHDAWSPFGSGDALERVALASYQAGWYEDGQIIEALDSVTTAAATMLGDEVIRLEPGDPADFTLIEASSCAAAVTTRPSRRIVVRAGQVVAEAPMELGLGTLSRTMKRRRCFGRCVRQPATS